MDRNTTSRIALALAALTACTTGRRLSAQEYGHDGHASPSRLGHVDFPNSGNATAQASFRRGIALLHSFQYAEAAEAFQAAERADTGFALPYWFEAMTHRHILWDAENLGAARAVLLRLGPTADARLAKAGTVRERAYGAAIEALFADADEGTRARAFADSMRRVTRAYPADLEAAAFASVAIQGAAIRWLPPEQRTPAQLEAAVLAERVFRANPRHPGAAHYMIHAYDDPALAGRGLRAARAYAAIAPDADHALHMPSHIFVQLGLWDDDAESNERAWAASRAAIRRRRASPTELGFHTLIWLQYAYLQQGRYRAARALVDSACAVLAGVPLDTTSGPDARYAVSEVAFRYAAETAHWAEVPSCRDASTPPAIDPATVGSTSIRERGFASRAIYQIAVERAMRGDAGAADAAATRFRELAAAQPSAAPARAALEFRAVQLDALASLARAERDSALSRLRRAAVLEDATPAIGPPGALPTHELLGSALLAADSAAEAAREYQRALHRSPNRSAAVLGLARALRLAGDTAGAQRAYRQFRRNWHQADPDLGELADAK